jgi:hypothetical protein
VRHSLLVVVLGLLGCPAVLVEPGNDFPCDFSKPPGERDGACSPGDVCGVDNRCQRYVYEGPQFEGLPTFPDFDAGASLHPLVLRDTVEQVAAVAGEGRTLAVRTVKGAFLVREGEVEAVPLASDPGLLDVVPVVQPQAGLLLVGRRLTGEVVLVSSGRPVQELRPGGPVARAVRLRGFESKVFSELGTAWVVAERPGGGELGFVRTTPFSYVPMAQGRFLDVAPAPRIALALPRAAVALSADGLVGVGADGGLETLASGTFDRPALLQTDGNGNVYAALSRRGGNWALTTWQVIRTGTTFTVEAPWSDCVPCPGGRDLGVPLALTPGVDLTGPFVEVLCPSGLIRVRGATTSGVGGACLTETAGLPFDLAALAREERTPDLVPATDGGVFVAEQDFANPSAFVAGGRQGQLWLGDRLSTARPVFLDRVPRDVVGVSRPEPGLVALTDQGLFARPLVAGPRSNGFRTVGEGRSTAIAGLVHEGDGWAVTDRGDVVRIGLGDGGSASLEFGPTLVDGRGAPVTRVLHGEAVVRSDGGLISMVIAADDSLFIVPGSVPLAALASSSGTAGAQLTPEPSVAIASLALERTALATNGVDRFRGYLVTSRSVYEFTLGGSPLRWSTKRLTLSGAEPLEVWFDNPRGGLARAGYRDGTVFSIPGGFQLTEPLPGGDAGVPAAVRDYENLGGWPVALTTTGLYLARWDALASGRLDNRFADGGVNKPMPWREVRLPDGTRPWLKPGSAESHPGKLFVLAEPQTLEDGVYRRVFRLFVFLPTQVLEVGRHVRTNRSAVRDDGP